MRLQPDTPQLCCLRILDVLPAEDSDGDAALLGAHVVASERAFVEKHRQL